jgi:hypothetical protein
MSFVCIHSSSYFFSSNKQKGYAICGVVRHGFDQEWEQRQFEFNNHRSSAVSPGRFAGILYRDAHRSRDGISALHQDEYGFDGAWRERRDAVRRSCAASGYASAVCLDIVAPDGRKIFAAASRSRESCTIQSRYVYFKTRSCGNLDCDFRRSRSVGVDRLGVAVVDTDMSSHHHDIK